MINRVRNLKRVVLYAIAERQIGLMARHLVPHFTIRRGVHLVAA